MHFRRNPFIAAASLFFLVFGGACRDTNQVDPALLTGRWILQSGFIDGKQNDRLNGTFFQFYPDGTMETNLPLGFDPPTPFEVDGEVLLQKGEQTFRYRIESVSDTQLVLSTDLRGTQFRFDLMPAPEIEEVLPDQEVSPPNDTFPSERREEIPADQG
ncbi:MAG: hypothetical protein SFV52_05770 [Saprospiraceae bacterium]|nr:hypothetical protein [Saprospiraceae bacterium]